MAARLAEQPIFYPMLNQEHATMIARDWNPAGDGAVIEVDRSVNATGLVSLADSSASGCTWPGIGSPCGWKDP